MLLSNSDILEALAAGILKIEPFEESRLQPASYDLTAGDEAVARGGAVDIKEQGYVQIPRGSTAIIATKEVLKLSTSVAGHFGLRSSFARDGLVLLSGPQVDPGFEGILSITVFNSGVDDVTIVLGEAFATIEFVFLKNPASVAYSGSYQEQRTIPVKERARIGGTTTRSFSEIEKLLDQLDNKIGILTNVVVQVIVGIALLVSGGIIGFLLGRTG